MPGYDMSFRPPAPLARVVIKAAGLTFSDVPMLIDTGADLSLLPRDAIVAALDENASCLASDLRDSMEPSARYLRSTQNSSVSTNRLAASFLSSTATTAFSAGTY
jgi:hypothetical protein